MSEKHGIEEMSEDATIPNKLDVIRNMSADAKADLLDQLLDVLQAHIVAKKGTSEPPKKPRQSATDKLESVTAISDTRANDLYQRLKTWRNQVARDLGLPAYMVFGNQVLTDLAHYRPTTEDELKRIKGMGPEKLGKYGDAIIEIVTVKTSTSKSQSLKTTEFEDGANFQVDTETNQLPRRRYLPKNTG